LEYIGQHHDLVIQDRYEEHLTTNEKMMKTGGRVEWKIEMESIVITTEMKRKNDLKNAEDLKIEKYYFIGLNAEEKYDLINDQNLPIIKVTAQPDLQELFPLLTVKNLIIDFFDSKDEDKYNVNKYPEVKVFIEVADSRTKKENRIFGQLRNANIKRNEQSYSDDPKRKYQKTKEQAEQIIKEKLLIQVEENYFI
jgi:hypothetical protein